MWWKALKTGIDIECGGRFFVGLTSTRCKGAKRLQEDSKEQYKFYLNLGVSLAENKTLRKEEKGITRGSCN